jgi:glycine hydroxymethyltransferase
MLLLLRQLHLKRHYKKILKYTQKIHFLNAKAMAKGLLDNNITLVTGGTENHMVLIDLRPERLKGKIVEEKLDELGLCTNKNSIPDDTASPLNPSGLRLGVPSITTRGIK